MGKIDLDLAAVFQWALAEQKKLESGWWGSSSYTPTITDIILARLLVAELDNQSAPMKPMAVATDVLRWDPPQQEAPMSDNEMAIKGAVFAILMQKNAGLLGKAPSYIEEKLNAVMKNPCPVGMLDRENLEKLAEWANKWKVVLPQAPSE